ncbi:hypothetical protein TNIN_350511 [Trichonephila inaurata madagascariensis]|uniref:Uncharacterized protein n=1 Tax=Trichonephila inaurata madagascariensis TaxID=2747483 RepID=A0A8X6YN65_9ARAC|nr:hypothetical protein TNIN_350511 [Trichonephila inaurata madagascariensis]
MRPWERARDLYLDEDRVKQKECEPVSTDECATERKIVIVHRERGAVKSWGIICSSAAPCVCPAMATSSFNKQKRLAINKNRFRNRFIFLVSFRITPTLLYDLRNKWSVPYIKKQCPRTKMPQKIGGPIQYYHLSPRTHTATCRLLGESSSPHPRHD